MHRSQHRLRAIPPYDGRRLLAFVGAHAVPGLESWDGTTYRRVLRLPGGPGAVAVTADDAGADVALDLLDGRDEPAALRLLRQLLDLDRDVRPAEAALGADPLLGPLVRRRPGLRAPGSVDDAETLVRTIIGQQVSLGGARTVTGRLVAASGQPLPAELGAADGVRTAFPLPAALAALDPDGGALAMPRARARAVVAAAAAVRDHGGTLPGRAALLALPGVGPWTADYCDLRCRADPDVFLATDLAVRRVMAVQGVPATAVSRHAERWSPFRTTALLHLWADYLRL